MALVHLAGRMQSFIYDGGYFMSFIGVPGSAISTGVHWGPALHRIQFSILHIFKILDSWKTELYEAMWPASVSYPYDVVSRVAIWQLSVRLVYAKRAE